MELIINANDLDDSFIEAIKKRYSGKMIKITVTEVDKDEKITPKENWFGTKN